MTAYVVGYAMLGLGDDAWRRMLTTPAIPGIATVLLGLGTPESPRWLLSRGRVDDARAVVREVYGRDARIEDLPGEEAVETDFRTVWRQPYLNRMVFARLWGFGEGNQTYIVAAVAEIAFSSAPSRRCSPASGWDAGR